MHSGTTVSWLTVAGPSVSRACSSREGCNLEPDAVSMTGLSSLCELLPFLSVTDVLLQYTDLGQKSSIVYP